MFIPVINHPAINQSDRSGGYIPQGLSPVRPEPHTCNENGVCILHTGDRVRVESAWDRGDGFVLLYVRSVNTGEATHIPEADFRRLTGPSTSATRGAVGVDDIAEEIAA